MVTVAFSNSLFVTWQCEFSVGRTLIRRKSFSPESEGSYTVWHCEREYRWDKTKDYGREDEEFEKLKMEYLDAEVR